LNTNRQFAILRAEEQVNKVYLYELYYRPDFQPCAEQEIDYAKNRKFLWCNICRYTGYRPILDVFKGFASDALPQLAKDVCDIEV